MINEYVDTKRSL